MKKSRLIGALCAVLFSFVAVSANATLVSRLGGAAAYDTVLDITWLTDADLSGGNNWASQVAWASNLNYLGFTDWRLASMSVTAPPGSLPDTTITTTPIICTPTNGTACQDNELGYMYYHNLASISGTNKSGTHTIGGVTLTDIQTVYWSGTERDSVGAWRFRFDIGSQNPDAQTSPGFYGWAVADGDVFVPIPPALWLFGSGLLGLMGIARHRKL